MTDPTPLRYARPNQCRFCTSRACRMRIYTEDGSFDEVSCGRHQDALCRHAVRVAPGVPKMHGFSTDNQRRGEPPGFANFRAEIAALEAVRPNVVVVTQVPRVGGHLHAFPHLWVVKFDPVRQSLQWTAIGPRGRLGDFGGMSSASDAIAKERGAPVRLGERVVETWGCWWPVEKDEP